MTSPAARATRARSARLARRLNRITSKSIKKQEIIMHNDDIADDATEAALEQAAERRQLIVQGFNPDTQDAIASIGELDQLITDLDTPLSDKEASELSPTWDRLTRRAIIDQQVDMAYAERAAQLA